MTILSHHPDANGVSTDWTYQLTNSKGKALKGKGYSVEEHIKQLFNSGMFGNDAGRTSEGEFVPAVNGQVIDNVGVQYQPPAGSNGIHQVLQTFTVDFKGVKFNLPTLFEHDTRVVNGQVTKSDVTVVTP